MSMDTGNNVIGGAIVQALSVGSRLGVFLQSFALAWIIDDKLYLDSRTNFALSYLAIILLSILFSKITAPIIVEFTQQEYTRNKVVQKSETDKKEIGIFYLTERPNIYAVYGYLFLYLGAIIPLIGQLLLPSFAARSIALATIINGLSTIILIAYLDLKIAYQLESKEYSKIPGQLMSSKLVAIIISFILVLSLHYSL